MAEIEVKPCSNPGCDQPGTSSCSACKTTVYCSVICQTADWTHHKEQCQGHLRKVGIANLAKVKGFHDERNWEQTLRYGELAASKLKQLKDRSLKTVQLIDLALGCKFDALQFLGQHRDAIECAEERYTLWAMNHLRNPGSMTAALGLIQSCLHNEEYEDAERYARHAMFMIAEMTDNFIPADLQPRFLADVSYLLARAIHGLAKAGGIPPEGKQKAGEEAIAFARKAIEIHTQLHGTEGVVVAADLGTLADALDYFNNVDDDEILRLLEQAIATYRRVEGTSSSNVAVGETKLGNAYVSRSRRAEAANDLDRCLSSLELSLSHFHEAARINTANNLDDTADNDLCAVAGLEERIQQIRMARSARVSATAAAATLG